MTLFEVLVEIGEKRRPPGGASISIIIRREVVVVVCVSQAPVSLTPSPSLVLVASLHSVQPGSVRSAPFLVPLI